MQCMHSQHEVVAAVAVVVVVDAIVVVICFNLMYTIADNLYIILLYTSHPIKIKHTGKEVKLTSFEFTKKIDGQL